MMDPLAARYAGLPALDALSTMSPAEIGQAILPKVAARVREGGPSGFVPRDFARGAANHVGRSSPLYEQLILEGLGFLDRAGMLVNAPGASGSDFFILSRSGQEAAAQAEPLVPTAAAGQEARALLHPRIAAAALGHVERGGSFLDDAATAAFREVEERVRKGATLSTSVTGKEVFYKALGENPRGRLIPPDLDAAEARSLKEMLAGAYGFFRNPSAHRHAQDNPTQTMRVLLMASAFMYILDDLDEQRTEPAQKH